MVTELDKLETAEADDDLHLPDTPGLDGESGELAEEPIKAEGDRIESNAPVKELVLP